MTEELKPLPCPFCNSPGARRIVCMTVPASDVMTPLTSCSNPRCPASEVSFTDDEWSGHRSPAWRDIESAPKDGTPILLWGGKPDHYASEQPPEPVVVAWWGVGDDFDPDPEDYEWRYCNYDGGYYGSWHDPMMWAPLSLPLPPEETK